MDFLELAKKRYSCRNYKTDAVEEEKLMKVLEAARVAPSAVNYQPWHFFIVRNPENKARIAEAYQRDWMKTAPVLLIACGNKHISWKRSDGKEHMEIDISIAIDHLTLQATELGLATCWICNFQPKKLKEVLKVASHLEPVAIIPVGYPADETDIERHSNKRKPISEIITWELPA
ncbi:MAG: nitroreductase [Bacteroidales bacterium]|nr:nitroreductase [Bacteroidales bacterium]